jgi:hypothetical protein
MCVACVQNASYFNGATGGVYNKRYAVKVYSSVHGYVCNISTARLVPPYATCVSFVIVTIYNTHLSTINETILHILTPVLIFKKAHTQPQHHPYVYFI